MPRSNTKVRINLQGLKNNYYNYVQVFKEKDGCVEWIDAESKKRNQNEKKWIKILEQKKYLKQKIACIGWTVDYMLQKKN